MTERRPFATTSQLADALGAHKPARGQRIGLLGGSFNPAHQTHLTISLEAMKRLKLDAVWWLISPQNPLKRGQDTASQEIRVRRATTLTKQHKNIRITCLESLLGTRYSCHSLAALKKHFVQVHFVWLMGSDNLIQLPHWRRWTDIFAQMPIAVFARPPYSVQAMRCKAAQRFRQNRQRGGRQFCTASPPAWVFIHAQVSRQSSTQIRMRQPYWANNVSSQPISKNNSSHTTFERGHHAKPHQGSN